ncbi:MAG: hypothetical protein EA409_13360 [Saprospirales bacterium]|nr:MAG: hypothetical protein EA409_13360 [Saprospirales bacterium]
MDRQQFFPKFRPVALLIFVCVATSLLISSCKKETILISGNEPVSAVNISRIKIENYIQRVFIDLIGREPLEQEMTEALQRLQVDSLKRSVRMAIIYELMNDESAREGEGSYRAAYILNLYNLAKIRCMEGVSDGYIQSRINIASFGALKDSLEGNWDSFYRRQNTIRKYRAVIDSREQLFDRKIKFHHVFGTMINNGIYDEINMNTFNFVRAAFDELLWRLPTEEEFENSFQMVENEVPSRIFDRIGSNKEDFVDILIHSPAMAEGLIIWAFQIYLNRVPSPLEMITFLPEFIQTGDIDFIISEIMVTDEYANFR